jgi:hypothetical protein
MHQWQKLGRIFNPQDVADRPWLAEFAQAPATLVLEDRVRVYFSCRPPADADGQYASRSAWVDLDRRDLSRVLAVADEPILPLGETGTFDEFGTYPVSVARDGHRIVAYYAGWTRCESVPFNTAIGMAHSDDGGRTFAKAGPGPVLGYSPDEPFVLSGPKIRRWDDAWHLFYIAGRKWKLADGRAEPVYKIRRATSPDGIAWTKAGADLIPSRVEGDEAQASPDVFRGRRRFHMFFCYRHSTDYRNHARGYRIGYAHSTDLLHWTRDDACAGLDVSADGWDSEMVSYPHVFELDGRIHMLYLGNQVGRWGFGLARLEGTLD